MKSFKRTKSAKSELLLKIVGETVKKYRKKKDKGILLLSYEYDISSSSLDLVEKGLRDPQLTTIWKIANALDMSFGEFITLIEQQLPKDFLMIEDK